MSNSERFGTPETEIDFISGVKDVILSSRERDPPPELPLRRMHSRHHPSGGATTHCDSTQIETAIASYQTNRDLKSLSSIVALTETRALTLIRF